MDSPTDPSQEPQTVQEEEPPVPIGQVLFDNIFLWFLLSFVIAVVFYNVWGLFDLLRVPVAP